MKQGLEIYFAAALRGGANFGELARRIDFLESIGNVLTKHVATANLGLRDDHAIYAHDQRLLDDCHVFIADLAAPSTGTGFMAARAVASHKPVLCLYREGQLPSAMIAGCPEITTAQYATEDEFRARVRGFLLAHAPHFAGLQFRAPKIFLAGPPGSGKTTLGTALAATLGAAHVNPGDLLRALVTHQPAHPHAAAIAECMETGELVPAAIMQDLVVERLQLPDCRLFGVTVDGYPPSRDDLANLSTHGIGPDLVVVLEVSDATAIARSTDTPDKAFHAADAGFAALATWFPDRMVVRVDAEQPPEIVLARVLELVGNMFGNVRHEHSFFPVAPYRPETVRSTRLHFHVDARSLAVLRDIAREIYARDKAAQGQLKIYPIAALHLGPQIAQLPVYRQMPHFHEIESSDTEAFLTGRLGDGDDALMKHVIQATQLHGGVVEIEEYVGEWTLGPYGSVVVDAAYEPLSYEPTALAEFDAQRADDLPRLELHLGFDVPKAEHGELPIPLPALMADCVAGGLVNGGWFRFKNEHSWAYRSNEFSSEAVELAQARLRDQATTLQNILFQRRISAAVSFSLERVHGIWIV